MTNNGSPFFSSPFNPSNAAFIPADHGLPFSSPSLLLPHESTHEWEHFSYFQRHFERFQSKFSGSPSRTHISPRSVSVERIPARRNHRDPIPVRKNKSLFFPLSCNSTWSNLSLSCHLQALRLVIEILRMGVGRWTNRELSFLWICLAFGWFHCQLISVFINN